MINEHELIKHCRKIDYLANKRIAVEFWDCEDLQCYAIIKKNGVTLLSPIIICYRKQGGRQEIFD